MGGDGDTIQAASFLWRDSDTFDVVGLSVYRMVVDLADIAAATYVIPGGVSANPDSPHYQDQLPLWAAHRRIPMHYTSEAIRSAAHETLNLTPG
jgi:penicillin amidase